MHKSVRSISIVRKSYLEIFPRDGRTLLRAERRALNFDGRVAAVRLLRQGEPAEVKGGHRNLNIINCKLSTCNYTILETFNIELQLTIPSLLFSCGVVGGEGCLDNPPSTVAAEAPP